MHRMSFVAGATVALIVSAAGWSALQSSLAAPVKPAVADGSYGTALLSAVVNEDGTLRRGSGAVSAGTIGGSNYFVSFNRPISGCTYNAVVGATTNSNPPFGFASVTQYNTVDDRSVGVVTRNAAGTGTLLPFHLMVFCAE